MIALWIVKSVGSKYVFIIRGMDHTSSKSLRERERGYSNAFLSMEGRQYIYSISIMWSIYMHQGSAQSGRRWSGPTTTIHRATTTIHRATTTNLYPTSSYSLRCCSNLDRCAQCMWRALYRIKTLSMLIARPYTPTRATCLVPG